MRNALLMGLGLVLLLGCSQSTQPSAKRGIVEYSTAKKKPSGMPNPHGGGTLSADDDAGPEVKLEAITLTAPAGWQRKKPQSTFVEAEFALPRAEGDILDGRLTVSLAGGSIEANIDRWKDQFGGSPAKSHQDKMDVKGLSITLVDFSGDFNDQRGPFAPAVKRSDFRMVAGIIPVEGQLHFVKAVGPQKTMEIHADNVKEFLRTAKPVR